MLMKLTTIIVIVVSVLLQTQGKTNAANEEIAKSKQNDLAATKRTSKTKEHTTIEPEKEMKIPLIKCCDFGQVFYLNTNNCTNAWIFKIFHSTKYVRSLRFDKTDILDMIQKETVREKDVYQFILQKIDCADTPNSSQYKIHPQDFKLLDNGSLQVEMDKRTMLYEPNKYCIDNIVWRYSSSNLSHLYSEFGALICLPSSASKEAKTTHYSTSVTCMLISCFFIILTVAVYAWLPELRNLHGMVLMAYLISFFVGFVFLATLQILILHGQNTAEICISFTFIIYFSLLTAFFWMNVMCYDIWRTFSGRRSMQGSRKSTEKKRFLCYCLYAFGVPALLTGLFAVLEFSTDPHASELLPRLRLLGCFLCGKSKFIYLYVPIIVLCVVNLVFFALTAKSIQEIKKKTKMLNKNDKHRFALYIKLFIIMGVTWILEVVSSLWPKVSYIWQFTDAYNVLIGLVIFIIFVCKKKILRKIRDRYDQLMGKPLTRSQTTTTCLSTRMRSLNKDVEVQINPLPSSNKQLQFL